MAKKKWSAKGKHGVMLRQEIIDNDYIGRGIKASEVHKGNPIYYENYEKGAFRTNYNNMKAAIQKEMAEEKVKEMTENFDGMSGEYFYFILYKNHWLTSLILFIKHTKMLHKKMKQWDRHLSLPSSQVPPRKLLSPKVFFGNLKNLWESSRRKMMEVVILMTTKVETFKTTRMSTSPTW